MISRVWQDGVAIPWDEEDNRGAGLGKRGQTVRSPVLPS